MILYAWTSHKDYITKLEFSVNLVFPCHISFHLNFASHGKFERMFNLQNLAGIIRHLVNISL